MLGFAAGVAMITCTTAASANVPAQRAPVSNLAASSGMALGAQEAMASASESEGGGSSGGIVLGVVAAALVVAGIVVAVSGGNDNDDGIPVSP